jgi:hypothetical protein
VRLAGISSWAVSLALVLPSTATLAQPVPKGVTAAQLTDRALVDAFAQCIVAKHASDAIPYVLNSYTDWRERPPSTPRALKDKSCIPGQAAEHDANLLLQLSEDSIKVALAGALVRREFPTFDANVIDTAKALPSSTLVDKLFPPDGCRKCEAKRKVEFEDARAKLNNVMAPTIFGECAVRTDPAHAHALIHSWAASAEETAAFDALGAAFSNCLGQGAHFTATRSTLRGLVAISYYRIAHAPRAELAGTAK